MDKLPDKDEEKNVKNPTNNDKRDDEFKNEKISADTISKPPSSSGSGLQIAPPSKRFGIIINDPSEAVSLNLI